MNTTPLISIGELGLLDVVHTLYTALWISSAVLAEYQTGMQTHPLRPDLSRFTWISVHPAPLNLATPVTLDPGEIETIALARSSHTRLVLIDERRARTVAQSLGLPLGGTLGVLLEAKVRSLLPLVRPYLDQMGA